MLRLLQRRVSALLLGCSPPIPQYRAPIVSSSSSSSSTAHHLFSTAAAQNPPPKTPFIVDYLIKTCGFSQQQAIKTSKDLTRIESPSKPDSFIRFMKGNGFTDAHIKNIITARPSCLCSKVDKTLRPRLAALREMGFSDPDLVKLVTMCPHVLYSKTVRQKIDFFMPLLATHKSIVRAQKRDPYLLTSSLAETIIPNLSLVRQCGIPDDRIANMMLNRRFISRKPETLRAAVELTEEIGIPRGSGMFWHLFRSAITLSRATFDARLELLRSLGWSEDEVMLSVRKAPSLLRLSEKRIRRNVEFLLGEAGMERSYLASHPILLLYSLEKRLIPRHSVLRALEREGVLKNRYGLPSAASLTENDFVSKLILPYQEKIPMLLETYIAAIGKQIPSHCDA